MTSSSARGDIWDEEYYEEEVDEDSSWVEWEIPVDDESFISSKRDHPLDESTLASRFGVGDPPEPQVSRFRVEGGKTFPSTRRDHPFDEGTLGTRLKAPDPPEPLASRFCVEGGEQKTEIMPIRGARDPPEARYDALEPSVQLSRSSMSISSFFEVPYEQQQLAEQISLCTLSTKTEERYLRISNRRAIQIHQMWPDEEQPSSESAKMLAHNLREEQASSMRSRTEDQASVPAVESSIVKVEEDSVNPEHDSVLYRGNAGVSSDYEHTRPDMFQATVQKKGNAPWKVLVLALLYLLVVVVVVLAILYFVVFKEKDDGVIFKDEDNGATKLPTLSPTGSTQWLPAVSCSGIATTLTPKTVAEYERLTTELMVPSLYAKWEHNIESCHAANQAVLWLSAESEAFSAGGTTNLLQRYIIVFLFFSSEGADWASQDKWLSQHDVCEWEGLDCSSNGDLIKINLNGNKLKGPVISELGFLSKLQVLNLQHNALSGSLPNQVASLDDLQIMALPPE